MVGLVRHNSWCEGIILKRRQGRSGLRITPPPNPDIMFSKVLAIPDNYEEFIGTLEGIGVKYIKSQGKYVNSFGKMSKGIVMEKSELEKCLQTLTSKYAVPFRMGKSDLFIEK